MKAKICAATRHCFVRNHYLSESPVTTFGWWCVVVCARGLSLSLCLSLSLSVYLCLSLSLSVSLCLSDRQTERQTDRDRQTDRHRQTDRDRQIQTETDSDRQRDRETSRHIQKQQPPRNSLSLRKKERKKGICVWEKPKQRVLCKQKQCPIPFPLSPFLTMGRPAAQQPAHG